MNKRDMAACVREWGRCEINGRLHSKDICDAAAAALEREADAEEKAKPKVTLKEMISELENPYSVVPAPESLKITCYASTERERVCVAAANTIRRLDEEGKRFLIEARGQSELFSSGDIWPAVRVMCSFLRSVVTEPTP